MPTPPHHVAPFGAVEVPGAGGTDEALPGRGWGKKQGEEAGLHEPSPGLLQSLRSFPPQEDLVADTMRARLQAAYVLDDFNVSHFSKWFATRKRPMRPSRTPARYPLLEHHQPRS